jgi:glutamate-1-semialdehyde 2,1-aminomutase
MNNQKSQQLFERACGLFPGGVNSPVRAFKAVGGTPVFLARGEGAFVWDADGNRYTDFLGSWGPLILGHANPQVVAAIADAAGQGTTFGASTEREIQLGEAIRALFPSMERMRFVSSGTEATMSALRVARGFTGRSKLIKIDGGYHGHADMLLAAAGSGAATLGIPGSAGVTAAAVADTIIVPFNDERAMAAAFAPTRARWRRSSSNRSRATWVWCRPRPAISRPCAVCATRPAPCSSSTKSSLASGPRPAARRDGIRYAQT